MAVLNGKLAGIHVLRNQPVNQINIVCACFVLSLLFGIPFVKLNNFGRGNRTSRLLLLLKYEMNSYEFYVQMIQE